MALILLKAFPKFLETVGLHSGRALNGLSAALGSYQEVVAHAGGTKAAATVINSANVVITTCATGADSVLLPLGYAGLSVQITNNGAASAQIFGSGTDTINAVATGTGVALANGASARYVCVGVTSAGVGLWNRYVSS